MLPKSYRLKLMDGYHQYEHDFYEEAALSNDSFLSDQDTFRAAGGFKDLNQDERNQIASRRLDKMIN